MFRWIIGSSLQFRFVVLGAAVALLLFGGLRLKNMPVDVLPEFAAPVVQVQTEALGLSANEVESLITLNLEELLSGLPWLKSIRSKSVTGLSSIELTFERGTDLTRARQMIQERLTLAYTLPNVAHPPVILQPVSATNRFLMVGLSSTTVEPTELSMLARWTVKPKLSGVPGVANVAIWGQRLRQLQVHFDPQRLRDARLTQDDIVAAAGDALWVSPLSFLKGSAPGTGGWIDNRNQRLGVHHQMPIAAPEDLAKVPLGAQHLLMTGKRMSLGEVAEVTFSHSLLIGDAYVNGGAGLLLVLEKLPGANTLEVTRAVDQALAELALGLPGVKIDASVFRLASYIDDSIDNLAEGIVLAALLLVLALGAFLHHWRSALVAAVSIPLALAAALVALELAGATLNTMILAGLVLALGVVIDDVIVDADALRRRLREGRGGAGLARLIHDTVLQNRGAALYGALIVVLAVMPIFFMGGVSGAFFEPLAAAYLLAVAASMIIALSFAPALSLILGAGPSRESPLAAALRTRYQGTLARSLKARRRVFAAAGAMVLAGVAVWPFLGQSLLPAFREPQVLVNWAAPAGTSYAETYRITARVCRELRALPGVRNVGAHVGRAVTGDQVVGINSAQIWVSIDPQADHAGTLAAIRETVEGYPGLERNVQTYLRDKIGEVLTGAASAIVVRIYGQKREVLQAKAAEVRQALSGIPGIVDLRAESQIEEPQVRVKVDLDAAGKANVKPGDVRRSAATVFAGLTVGFLFEDQKIYDVVVWGAPETRHSLTSLREVWVEKADRSRVRLGEVAEVSIVPTPTVIRHEKIAPYVDVVANVAGRDLGSVAKEVEDRLHKIEFPLEYHPMLLGEYAERREAAARMLGVALAGLAGIFLLLHACFRSWRLALVGFLALPAALAGGVLAVFAAGGVVTLGSIVGFLAVLGIAARHGLLLIRDYQHLEAEEPERPREDIVVRGAAARASAILASSAASVAVMAPLIALGSRAGLEILQPMAIVIVGGVVASTLVTLYVMPLAYLAAGAKPEPDIALELTAR